MEQKASGSSCYRQKARLQILRLSQGQMKQNGGDVFWGGGGGVGGGGGGGVKNAQRADSLTIDSCGTDMVASMGK